MMEKKRSIGVTSLGNLEKWGSVFVLSLNIFFYMPAVFSSSPPLAMMEGLERSGFTLAQRQAQAIIAVVWAIIHFVMGDGLLKLKEWSRKGLIFLYIGTPFLSLLQGLETKQFILLIIVNLCLTFFLTRPKVKEQFR